MCKKLIDGKIFSYFIMTLGTLFSFIFLIILCVDYDENKTGSIIAGPIIATILFGLLLIMVCGKFISLLYEKYKIRTEDNIV